MKLNYFLCTITYLIYRYRNENKINFIYKETKNLLVLFSKPNIKLLTFIE